MKANTIFQKSAMRPFIGDKHKTSPGGGAFLPPEGLGLCQGIKAKDSSLCRGASNLPRPMAFIIRIVATLL
ncbi:hypothetical protein [Domibacillus tundrae]|uniref:hypothetical protein n=1 Tax=Domibacillus tundrae TaxID=1587527 RepID=UPI0033994681